MKKSVLSAVCAIIFIVCAVNVKAANIGLMPDISAECAVIVESKSGCIIAGKNENKRASMASTTKIMTALILCETCDLDETAVVTANMVCVEGSSMGLLPGDTVHYRDLLYGMMLASGNDAATATAILIGGSVESFSEIMNKRAKEIGMSNTHFVTPSGLDDEAHYSTAADMAKLAVTAMKNPKFAEAAGSKSAQLEYGNPPYKRTLTNHNKLLRYYSGCNGVKTGFTKKSGRCLVSSAVRGNAGIIAVTLNAPNDWHDHELMLNYGFSCLSEKTFSAPPINDVTVAAGTSSKLKVGAEQAVLCLPENKFNDVVIEIELAPVVFAPVKNGEIIGRILYKVDGNTVAEINITAAETIPSNNTRTCKNFLYWFKAIFASK